MNQTNTHEDKRLHFLDTLRVAAIVVLVFYHLGMVYVPDWGFHYKRPIDGEWLQSLMLLSSPWRMGLLWIISGCALAFAVSSVSNASSFKPMVTFTIRRTNQLLLPLLVGIVFIVPVQLFVEMKQANAMPLDFGGFMYALFAEPKDYFADFSSGIWPRFDVNHLWFLRSLWQFSLVLILLYWVFSFLQRLAFIQLFLSRASAHMGLLYCLFTLPVLMTEMLLEGEAIREAYGFCVLALGFCLAKQSEFWCTLERNSNKLSAVAILSMLVLQLCFVFVWQSGLYEELSANKTLENTLVTSLVDCVYVLNKIAPIVAILALAKRYLNRPNKQIRALNAFVFPLYIIHQSVIVLIAYLLNTVFIDEGSTEATMTAGMQMLVNMMLTPLICISVLYAISKVNVFRVCFGMRLKDQRDPYASSHRKPIMLWAVFLLCLPMGLSILF